MLSSASFKSNMEGETEQIVESEAQEVAESEYGLETISLTVVAPNGHKISLQVSDQQRIIDFNEPAYFHHQMHYTNFRLV